MSYEKLDTPDPKWLMPLFIILILGLIVWGVSASVKYVEEEGMGCPTYTDDGRLASTSVKCIEEEGDDEHELVEYYFGFVRGDTIVKTVCQSTKITEIVDCFNVFYSPEKEVIVK